jgi:hypothetical protein
MRTTPPHPTRALARALAVATLAIAATGCIHLPPRVAEQVEPSPPGTPNHYQRPTQPQEAGKR